MTSQGSSVCDCSDGGEAPDAPTCTYPPVRNDPLCPATYTSSEYGQSCPSVGLTCTYPGAGDPTSDGCSATAMMWCRGDGGAGTPGTWTVAQ
jgi:hypothetical protein